MKLKNIQIIAFVLTAAIFLIGSGTLKADETNSAPSRPGNNNTNKLIEATEAEKLIVDKKVTVLDVRMAAEFASGHIAGATNLDISSSEFKGRLAQLDKDKPYLVHCAVGMRSAKACKLMDQEGFKTIYDLKGGLTAWKKAGLPLEK